MTQQFKDTWEESQDFRTCLLPAAPWGLRQQKYPRPLSLLGLSRGEQAEGSMSRSSCGHQPDLRVL